MPSTDRRSTRRSRAASSEAPASSFFSDGHAWTTLYPSTSTLSTASAEAHVRLAVEDERWVDLHDRGQLENRGEEDVAHRRDEPEDDEDPHHRHRSVLHGHRLRGVRQPRPDDAEAVQARHRDEVEDHGDGLDETEECQRAEEVDVGDGDPVLVPGPQERNRYQEAAKHRAGGSRRRDS